MESICQTIEKFFKEIFKKGLTFKKVYDIITSQANVHLFTQGACDKQASAKTRFILGFSQVVKARDFDSRIRQSKSVNPSPMPTLVAAQ